MTRTTCTRIAALLPLLIAGFGCQAQPDDQQAHVERMAKEHANDRPISNPASEAEPAMAVDTEEVQYATVNGRQVTGYLARPADAEGPLPGLIVIHEWWGLNDNIRAMARRLAGEGYAALAVDLYNGEVADTPDAARSLMTATNQSPEGAEENLRQAYDYLTDELSAPAVGSIGWCFGGGWSLRTALLFPEQLDAAVIYYGHLVTDRERLKTLEMPILGLFGGEDQGIPIEDVRTFEETLHELGKDATIIVYPGAGHAFANPSGQNYQPETAEKAWRETIDFLQETLKSTG